MSKLVLYFESVVLAQKFESEGYVEESDNIKAVAMTFAKERFSPEEIKTVTDWVENRNI
jgi:hypothetical protein